MWNSFLQFMEGQILSHTSVNPMKSVNFPYNSHVTERRLWYISTYRGSVFVFVIYKAKQSQAVQQLNGGLEASHAVEVMLGIQ